MTASVTRSFALPHLSAELAQFGLATEGPDVLLHYVDLADGDVYDGVVGELDREILILPLATLKRLESHEAADAVQRVDHQVTGLKIEEAVDRAGRLDAAEGPPLAVAVKHLVVRDVSGGVPLEAAVQHTDRRPQPCRPLGQLVKQLGEAFFLGDVVAEHEDVGLAGQLTERFDRGGRLRLKLRQGADVEIDHVRRGTAEAL